MAKSCDESAVCWLTHLVVRTYFYLCTEQPRNVGIRAAVEEAPGWYLLRIQPKNPSRLVSGKRFFQHHGLPVEKAQTFPAWDYGNGIIGFRFQDVAEEEQTTVPKAASTAKKATVRKQKSAA